MPNANLGPGPNLAVRISNIEKRLDNLMTTPWLMNASTGQGTGNPGIRVDQNGVHAFNASNEEITAMLTADGSVTAYDSTGAPVARFGPLTNSNPGHYGVETLVAGAWVQVGGGTVDWSNIANKPATYAPSAHTHAGGDITSQVSSAAGADGSQYGFSHAVAGTSFYALWVGNDTGYHFGTNASSVRHKRNVRRHRISPERVLALKPVIYTKPANADYVEYGLLAEQAVETMPEIVQWMDGKIHGVRYDLLSVALLEVVQEQERRINALERGEHPTGPGRAWHPPETKANNPPPHPEKPLTYTITED